MQTEWDYRTSWFAFCYPDLYLANLQAVGSYQKCRSKGRPGTTIVLLQGSGRCIQISKLNRFSGLKSALLCILDYLLTFCKADLWPLRNGKQLSAAMVDRSEGMWLVYCAQRPQVLPSLKNFDCFAEAARSGHQRVCDASRNCNPHPSRFPESKQLGLPAPNQGFAVLGLLQQYCLAVAFQYLGGCVE